MTDDYKSTCPHGIAPWLPCEPCVETSNRKLATRLGCYKLSTPSNMMSWPPILFTAIAPRPGMYIGTDDAQGVVMYVRGYQESCRHQGLEEHQEFFDGFRDWLVHKYAIGGDHGWDTALRAAGIMDAKRCCANVMRYMEESKMVLPSYSEAIDLWVKKLEPRER